MWGVEQLGASGVMLRLVVKTTPSEQWRISRAAARADQAAPSTRRGSRSPSRSRPSGTGARASGRAQRAAAASNVAKSTCWEWVRRWREATEAERRERLRRNLRVDSHQATTVPGVPARQKKMWPDAPTPRATVFSDMREPRADRGLERRRATGAGRDRDGILLGSVGGGGSLIGILALVYIGNQSIR